MIRTQLGIFHQKWNRAGKGERTGKPGSESGQLADMGINVTRSQVGNFFTSLEMAGASLTVMRLDDELTELYDAPMHTAGWRAGM